MQEDLKYNNPIPVAVAIVPIKREKTYKINNQEVTKQSNQAMCCSI